MGRRRKGEDSGGVAVAEKKRKAVKTKRINREHAGKVVEPYRILERLVAEEDQFSKLREAKFVLLWKKGWRPDTDGILIRAKIRKASELDRELGDEFDFAILLSYELWNETKIDEAKEIDLFHELCHAAPEMDRDGEQRRDDRGRLCWRLRKHVIQEFPECLNRYGLMKITGLNAAALAALDDVAKRERAKREENDGPGKRPLLDAALDEALDEAQANIASKVDAAASNEEWKKHKLDVLRAALTEKQFEALESTHLKTLGELQAKMNAHGMWWAKELGIHGRNRDAIETAFSQHLVQVD